MERFDGHYHPTQILADFLTIQEKWGTGRRQMVFAGDGRNNMANSLMIGCAKMGLHFVIAAPETLQPEESLRLDCQALADATGGSITVTEDLESACQDADVLYTDVWCSMGEEDKMAERVQLLAPYQINAGIMKKAKDTAIFLHCLPAVKGNEVTKDVFESPQSVVFDEAENRMHTIKAVMVATIGNRYASDGGNRKWIRFESESSALQDTRGRVGSILYSHPAAEIVNLSSKSYAGQLQQSVP
ncbi:MAG: ornithine carbamoyltransferase [Bianqueaceae bacterium]